MKLGYTNAGTVISSEGVQTTSSFNIARTPHMFNILSSGLYSDKIAAVLREIACNAMDAHVMAGKPDHPFQVKLPTTLDRTFYVKDWGPGLTDQQVRELYTTYGWSSKQNDDNVTGAFGLGSKSPFAYTMENDEDADGFTVVAAKDGVKRVYTCHIGDDGGPAISRLFEGPSEPDWPNGVMVTFPVQSRDIAEFHRKAREVLRWFRVKPEVLGLDGKLEEPEFEFNGSFFRLKPRDKSVDNGGPQVIMGNVRYPINAGRLGSLSKTEQALLSSNVHLFVPIGTVMMTPSREELQYTDATRTNLREQLGRAAQELANRVRDDVMTPEPTRWAWYKKIQSYYDLLPYGVQMHLKEFLLQAGVPSDEVDEIKSVVSEKVATVPLWVGDGLEGKVVPPLRDANGRIEYDASGAAKKDTSFDARSCRVWYYERRDDGRVRRREVVRGKVRSGSDYAAVHMRFLSNVHVYYADSTAADARIRALVDDREVDEALLVVVCKGTPATFAKEYAEKLVNDKALHGLPLTPSSAVPVPAKYEADKKRRRDLKDKTPAEIFAEEAVKFWPLGKTATQDVELGDLEEAGDKYYIVCTDTSTLRNATFRNYAGEHVAVAFNGYYREAVSRALKSVVTALGLDINGAVLMPRESTARRLKLAEQGYKPLLITITEALKAPGAWETLTKGIDRTPDVDLTEMYRADDYGWLGILAHHAVKMTPFWRKYFARFGTSPVTAAALDFAARTSSARQAKETNPSGDIAQSLIELNNRLSNFSLPVNELGAMPYYEVRNKFIELAPTFGMLNEGNLVQLMGSSDESEQDKALTLLGTVLEMDRLVEDTGTFQLKLVA